MRQVNEQQITAMAPNANAVNNAKKISRSGGFIKLAHSADDSFYMGQCKGSGSSVYTVSADFIEEGDPVCRCSCPSRQFPCKHALALLIEMGQDHSWEICEIPEDILQKRAKKAAKEETAAPKPAKKTNKAARTKKLKKQLEGLDLAEQLVRELLENGLGTLSGTSVKKYQDLAKQLGDYYLPGPQRLIQSLALQVQLLNETKGPADAGRGQEKDFCDAVHILIYLRALIVKSRAYLTEKLEQDRVEDDNSVLYEELGGIWTLERLNELGLKKENARLVQLSFHEYVDSARKEMVDKGWWIDVDSGEISITYNYRPLRALKYVKEEDSTFQMVETPVLTYYPGSGNRRIRWDSQQFTPVTDEIRALIIEKAGTSLKTAVKEAKNELKNTLSDGRAGYLMAYDRLETTVRDGKTVYLLRDREGSAIELTDRWGEPFSSSRLERLPDRKFECGQVLFGTLWYDMRRQKICLQPYALIARDEILRLLY